MSDVINKIVLVEAIKPHPENYNVHPLDQIEGLEKSLGDLGQYRSVVLWEQSDGSYIQLAGHGVVEAMKAKGMLQVRADVHPPSLDPMRAKQILLADNLHAQKSEPDNEALVALLQEQQDIIDLESLGSDDETLRQMLEALGDEWIGESERDEEEDELPEQVETRAKVGDVWALGRHKIACIDSCDPEQVKRFIGDTAISFVWADPPYGISIVATNGYVGGGEAYDIPFGGVKTRGDVGGGASHIRKTGKPYIATKGLGTVGGAKPFGSNVNKGSIGAPNPPGSKNNLRIAPKIDVGKYAPVIGDDTTLTAITAYSLCAELFPQALHIWWGANYYANALPPSKCWIVWDKENTGNFADAELAWCSDDSAVRIFRHMWNGLMKDSEKGQRRVHPTQKPCALFCWAVEKYGKAGDIIFDPFLGSGISIIGAEMLKDDRVVYGCELSPEYCSIVIARYEQHTGQSATLLQRIEEGTHV